MAEYPDPESRNALEPGCSRCPALVESRECISWGNGSLDADVVVVGEAPAFGDPAVVPDSTDSKDSASDGRPRVGDSDAERWRGGNWTGMAYTSRHSGRKVRGLFADAGLAPDQLYFTNAVKCFPRADSDVDGEPPSNREPTAEERANCRPHLASEIEQIEPAVVATTGKHATLAVLEDEALDGGGFIDSVLEPVESPAFETTVLPLLHPSYQNVWLPRIGYTREEYVAAIGEAVERLR